VFALQAHIQRYERKPWCKATAMATGSANPHAQQCEIIKIFGSKQARLYQQRDNMQEAPAPAIHPVSSMPDSIIYSNPSTSPVTAGTSRCDHSHCTKSSHCTSCPPARKQMTQLLLEQQECSVEEGTKAMALKCGRQLGCAAQGQGQCNAQTRHQLSQRPLRRTSTSSRNPRCMPWRRSTALKPMHASWRARARLVMLWPVVARPMGEWVQGGLLALGCQWREGSWCMPTLFFSPSPLWSCGFRCPWRLRTVAAACFL
jgi:hypothetical protein